MKKSGTRLNVREERLKQWQDARFGLFVHWGLYSAGGLDCLKMIHMGIPADEYQRRLRPKFRPRAFDAVKLVRAAKDAGCRYMVFPTRHHEGYCLWETDSTTFSAHHDHGRDFVREYVEAARKEGMLIGFYYSLLDWRFESYFNGPRKDPEGWKRLVDRAHAQVRELMTRYGRIDILWYDGGWPPRHSSVSAPTRHPWGFVPTEEEIAQSWRIAALNRMVRKRQPGILFNNRYYPRSAGDFGTPEQTITPQSRPWELCDTMGYYWGCSSRDRNRKSPREILTRLITCASLGGNLLLNIGPRPDGSIQAWQQRILHEIGKWMQKHSEAIHGCDGEEALPFNQGLTPWRTTRKKDTLYLHLLRYPGPSFGIASARHDYHIRSAVCLSNGTRLKVNHEPTRDVISGLPARAPDPYATVVALKIRPKTEKEKARVRFVGVPCPE